MHDSATGLPGGVEAAPRIGNGVLIGRESAVIGGLEVADYCVLGAGSVLTKSLLNMGEVWVGNPARHIADRDPAIVDQLRRLVASVE
jgi:serine acetyltransferase